MPQAGSVVVVGRKVMVAAEAVTAAVVVEESRPKTAVVVVVDPISLNHRHTPLPKTRLWLVATDSHCKGTDS
jgi:hypothetical protein